jgi:hypothetical protein
VSSLASIGNASGQTFGAEGGEGRGCSVSKALHVARTLGSKLVLYSRYAASAWDVRLLKVPMPRSNPIRYFLLSPANIAGVRGQLLTGSNARSALAARLRGCAAPARPWASCSHLLAVSTFGQSCNMVGCLPLLRPAGAECLSLPVAAGWYLPTRSSL